MFRRGFIRLLALILALATMALADAQATVSATASNAAASNQVPASSPLPGIGTRIESCVGGGLSLAPAAPAGCGRWAPSGPVNVVLLSSGQENPYQDTLSETTPRWAPAQGGWLEARLATRGCGPGWRVSEQQVELRLNAVSRRHFKFIRPGCRWRDQYLTVGEAHTDVFDVRRCGGDHMTDLDQARDALVASLTSGGSVSRVEYRRWSPAGRTFPDGCGRRVSTDGLVAFVWLKA
jgi:hypothetical protein